MFFVMAILGCGDGSAVCKPARTVPTHYTSMAQCRAALPAELAANSDLSFPILSADCRANGALIVKAEAKINRG